MSEKEQFLRNLLWDLWNTGFVSKDSEIPIVGFDDIVPWHDCSRNKQIRYQNFSPPGNGLRIEVCRFAPGAADSEEPYSVCCLIQIINVAEGGGVLEATKVNWREKKEEKVVEVLEAGSRITIPGRVAHRLRAGQEGMKVIRLYLDATLFV
jgi:hypothetical protein